MSAVAFRFFSVLLLLVEVDGESGGGGSSGFISSGVNKVEAWGTGIIDVIEGDSNSKSLANFGFWGTVKALGSMIFVSRIN